LKIGAWQVYRRGTILQGEAAVPRIAERLAEVGCNAAGGAKPAAAPTRTLPVAGRREAPNAAGKYMSGSRTMK